MEIPNVGLLNEDTLKESLRKIGEIKDEEGQNNKFSVDEEDLVYKLRWKIADEFFRGEGNGSKFEDNLRELEKKLPFLEEKRLVSLPNLLEELRNKTAIKNKETATFVTGLSEHTIFLKSQHAVFDYKKIEVICLKEHLEKPLNDELIYKLKPCDLITIDVSKDVGFEVYNPSNLVYRGCSPVLLRCHHMTAEEVGNYLNYLKDPQEEVKIKIKRTLPLWECLLLRSGEIFEKDERILNSNLKSLFEIVATVLKTSGDKERILKPLVQGSLFQVVSSNHSSLLSFTKTDCFDPTRDVELISPLLCYIAEKFPSYGNRVLSIISSMEERDVDGVSHKQIFNLLLSVSKKLLLSVPEVSEDIESLDWRDHPLVPTQNEFQQKAFLDTSNLPAVKINGQPYQSEEDYYCTYFQLLRSECFYSLHKGIDDFRKGKVDKKTLHIYKISLIDIDLHETKKLSLKMKYTLDNNVPSSPGSSEPSPSEDSGDILYGNLLCFSFDGFKTPVWGTVSHSESKQGSNKSVSITLCTDVNKISDTDVIVKLKELADQKKEIPMIESPTFYNAYQPALNILQKRDRVPFKETLVECKAPKEPVFSDCKDPDWKILFTREASNAIKLSDLQGMKPVEQFQELCKSENGYRTTLDDSQKEAVELALKNDIALIQGPPGTGKSFIGLKLLHLLLSMGIDKNHGPVLVMTYKNNELNHFLKSCINEQVCNLEDIIRVGRGDDEVLGRRNLYKIKGSLTKSKNYIKLKRKIAELKKRVNDAYISMIENVKVILKFASRKQIASLLKMEEGNVNKENKKELEDLMRVALKEWLPKAPSTEEEDNSQQQQPSSPCKNNEEEFIFSVTDPSSELKERKMNADDEEGDVEVKLDSEQTVNMEEQLSNDSDLQQGTKKMTNDDLWEMSSKGRRDLFDQWQSEAKRQFTEASKEYFNLQKQFNEEENDIVIGILKKTRVVGMTVTGAAIRGHILDEVRPSVVIVEEAAEVLEAQLVSVIPDSVKQLIMIGDHKQLRPKVYNFRLQKEKNFGISMFERLANIKGKDKKFFVTLTKQGRMVYELACLVQSLGLYTKYETDDQRVGKRECPQGMAERVFFCYHTGEEEREHSNSYSKYNPQEIKEITEIAKHLLENGNDSSKITVLCSYRAQKDMMEKEFKKENIQPLRDITVTTIDNYQGEQNDIILLSLVRSNKKNNAGFVKYLNRICVAVSRARCALYIFGNKVTLSGTKWMEIIKCIPTKSINFITKNYLISPKDNQRHEVEQKPSNVVNINVAEGGVAHTVVGDNSVMNIHSGGIPRETAQKQQTQSPAIARPTVVPRQILSQTSSSADCQPTGLTDTPPSEPLSNPPKPKVYDIMELLHGSLQQLEEKDLPVFLPGTETRQRMFFDKEPTHEMLDCVKQILPEKKWKNLGSSLGLSQEALNDIERSVESPRERIAEVLEIWMKSREQRKIGSKRLMKTMYDLKEQHILDNLIHFHFNI